MGCDYASEPSRVSTIKLTLMRDRREPVDETVRACEPIAANVSAICDRREPVLRTCEPVEYASETSRVSIIKLTLMCDRREPVDATVRACEPVAANASARCDRREPVLRTPSAAVGVGSSRRSRPSAAVGVGSAGCDRREQMGERSRRRREQ